MGREAGEEAERGRKKRKRRRRKEGGANQSAALIGLNSSGTSNNWCLSQQVSPIIS